VRVGAELFAMFQTNKLVKTPAQQLKSILDDFYSVEVLNDAKVPLASVNTAREHG